MTAHPDGVQARHPGVMRPIRYLPLVSVVALTVITGGIGFSFTSGGATANSGGTPAAPAPPPVLEIIDGDGEPTLPALCRPPVPRPPSEPWADANAESSDGVWQANQAALGQAYVEGDDGFVFWGDIQNNNFSQAVGRRTLSVDELQLWVDSLRAVHDSLTAAGIDFYIVPSPAKWDVYPEKLPTWAQEIDGSGPLDQLLIAAPDLPIIDVRADLRVAAEQTAVYSTVNSHWSDYGAWVGWSAISACINAAGESDEVIAAPAITGTDLTVGGNEFSQWGFSAPSADWSVPILVDPLLPTVITVEGKRPETRTTEQRVGLEEMPASTFTPGALSPRSLLLVRDSMGVSLSTWAQQSFEQTRQIRHAFDLGDPALIPDIASEAVANGSDIVILQFAQRHLNAPPDLTNFE